MKLLTNTILACLLVSLPSFLLKAQDASQIPAVQFTQGKIIGDLPYGQHFFIVGSTKLPDGNFADKVKVEIWRTGRDVPKRKKRELAELTKEQMALLKSNPNNLVNVSEWYAFRADNLETFQAYINTTLKFQTEYLVDFSYSRVFKMELTTDEKNDILAKVIKRSVALVTNDKELTSLSVKELLDEETRRVVLRKLNVSEESFFNREKISENLPVVEESSLEALASAIQLISSEQELVNRRETRIKELNSLISKASDAELPDLKDELGQRKEQLAEAKVNLTAAEEAQNLPEILDVIRKQMAMVGKEYAVSAPNATSIPALNAIKVGTTFGGGAVGLNVPSEKRDFDTFGYTALKYYLAPVDKRIADPYLTDKFLLSRMSFLVGVSTKDDFNYRGASLEKAFAFTPLVGMSIDVNRYFTIDLGMTTFKQTSLSPLSNEQEVRVGPIVGLNLDADMFNRVSSLVSGEKYKISPAPNK